MQAQHLVHYKLTRPPRLRPGRPSDPNWVLQGKVPMTEETKEQLTALAEKLSSEGRRVSPMQVAAQLLEESVSQFAEDE